MRLKFALAQLDHASDHKDEFWDSAEIDQQTVFERHVAANVLQQIQV